MTATLTRRLKLETKSLHIEVERAGIMPEFLRGKIERSGYCALLRNLYEIYAALEPAIARNAGNPKLAHIQMPQLARTAAIGADLRKLHGLDWMNQLPICGAAVEYRQRIATIEAGHPLLLLAHAYVRYLGDLSGGQILRRIVAGALHLDASEGTRFYEFAEPGASALASSFRAALDAVPTNSAEEDLLLAEAKLGFSMHVRLFRQLEPSAAPAPADVSDRPQLTRP